MSKRNGDSGRSTTRHGRRSRAAFRGCLLGGAVGDALGAPIEFMELAEIRRRHGPAGVTGLVAGTWPAGTITDDTQMTLFTAEAMIRGRHRWDVKGIASAPGMAVRSYLRWLHTQGEPVSDERLLDGWLLSVPELHARRAPGTTCLAALRAGGNGTRESPANDSKGCGGVMRIAPIGLALPDSAFENGCELAAITHGHPTGQLPAGFLAELIARLVAGAELREAVRGTLARLQKELRHEETTEAVEKALALADESRPSPSTVELLGGGWIAEEALAVGLYCALVAKDFASGVLLAVNHGGDSDSTGSIAGNLLGLLHGEEGIPKRWLERLELRREIGQVADDLWGHFGERSSCSDEDLTRYPAW